MRLEKFITVVVILFFLGYVKNARAQENPDSLSSVRGPSERLLTEWEKLKLDSALSDKSPIDVVDGKPYEELPQHLRPEDLKTINVLRPKAAMAIYGSHGGDGVILITTKAYQEPKID